MPPAPIYSSAGRLSNGPVTVGNQEEVRFYFAMRELTIAEDEHFFDLDRESFPGLPAGVGYTPPNVLFEYAPPGSAFITLEGDDVVEDAEGEYHAIITAPMDGNGVWTYRGRAVDGEGTPLASTPRRTFTVVGGEVAEVVPPTAIAVERGRAEAAEQSKLAKANDLSDLASPAAARTNLGLGTAATHAATDFDAAGAAAAAQQNAEAASDVLGAAAAAKAAAEAASVPLTQKGAANGVATLDGSGLLPSAQLPPLALTDPHVVHSEAEQLALPAHEGTFAIRTDTDETFAHNGGVSKTMADWTAIVTPGDVQSVNGHTGTVALTYADVGADKAGLAAAAQAASVPVAQKGAAGGVAELDGAGKLPLAELPPSVVIINAEGVVPIGAGDLLGARVGVPPAVHKLDVREGTAAAPVKIGVSASYSRVDATTRAELNAMGPEGTDGPDGATIIRAAIKGAPGSQVQISSVVAQAWQTGAYEGTGADACPIQGLARTSGGATGRAIGAYFEANREVAAGGQQGIEIRVKNSSGASDTYVANAGSKSMGIWLNASSAGEANSAAAIQIGHGFGRTFDVGLGFNASSIATSSVRDDSNSTVSLDIRGEHSEAAIKIGSKAGPIIFNNASGNFKLQQAFNAGDYLTGTAAGDGVILTGTKPIHIGCTGIGGERASLRVGKANITLAGQSAADSYGGGTGVVFIANASVAPPTNPAGGGILYAEGGALKWRGSAGTVTEIAKA